MFCSNIFGDRKISIQFRSWGLLFVVMTLAFGTFGQEPSPSPSEVPTVGGFKITSSIELGVRGSSVSGNEDKYRSDFNYKQGFRVFDSSFLMENVDGSNPSLDSLLITTSGWGADPSGFTRVMAEKIGVYRLTSNVRRFAYFNKLNNFALGQHTKNTTHNMGNADVTILPQNEKFNFTLGYSFDKTRGPGTWTIRSSRDEFQVDSDTNNNANDFRAGISTRILGFKMNLSTGARYFSDRSNLTWEGLNLGNNTGNNATISSFLRQLPVDGTSYFSNFSVNRTFARKFDITARGIFTNINTRSSMNERVVGRDGSNNFVDLDRYSISGDAKRIQKRGDIGMTWRATDRFTISNTFTYDAFGIDGGMDFEQQLFRRNAGGNPLATVLSLQNHYRVNDYRRYLNLIEGDVQVSNRFSFNIGYRFTSRRLQIAGFRNTLTSPPSGTNPLIIDEENDNQTHSIIGGVKFKPTKRWVIWADVEHGETDNVFTRVSNYEFTNFRVRSRAGFGKFSLNLSAISKDNTNPSQTFDVPPQNFGVKAKTRIFSGSFDWNPDPRFGLSTGYTYQYQDSETAILSVIEQPDLSRPRIRGLSQYFVRDHVLFVDVFAQPHRRVSFFGSYRLSKDTAQGSRSSALLQNIISGYPMEMQSPEFRMAFRLSRFADWNFGYQYLNYKEMFPMAQDYRAHLPYTSLRIFFGRSTDR